MDKLILILARQGTTGVADLAAWAKRCDLGVECQLHSAAPKAMEWMGNVGRPVDAVFAELGFLRDGDLRDSLQGLGCPVVALVTAEESDALAAAREGGFREPFLPAPATGEVLRQALPELPRDLETWAAWLWDPDRLWDHAVPVYLEDLGVSKIYRVEEESPPPGRSAAGLAVAHFGGGDARAWVRWRRWLAIVKAHGGPAVAVLESTALAALRELQAVAAVFGPERLWRTEVTPTDNQRLELLQAVDQSRLVRRYLRETRLFVSRGTTEHAVSLLRHATSSHPMAGALWLALGEVEPDPGRAAEALARALRLEPRNRLHRLKAIRRLQSLGREEEAFALLRAAVENFPWDAGLRQSLAEHYQRRGDRVAARVELQRALRLDPALTHARLLLSRLTPA